MNKLTEPGIAALLKEGKQPAGGTYLAAEARASFAHHFELVARMNASVDEKVHLFQAKTKLVQHFLGLQLGEEHGQNYEQAGDSIKRIICESACEAIAKSGEPNAEELAHRAAHVDSSSQEKALTGLFGLYSPGQNRGVKRGAVPSSWDMPI